MNKYILYVVLIVSLLPACGKKGAESVPHSDKRLLAIDSFEIQTGFTPFHLYSGFLEVGDSGYLYLANLLVHDSLHFYTYPGLKKRKSIPLKTIMDRGYELYNIQVASLDSIMFLGRYHNILFTIDDKGNIINERDLEPLCDADSFHVDLDLLKGDHQNLFMFNGKPYLLFNAANSGIKPHPTRSTVEIARKFYGSRYLDPSLALYSLTDGTLRFDDLALFRPLNPKGELMPVTMFYDYCRFKDKVLITSAYSDTLYVINPEHLTLEQTIPMRFSAVEKLGVPATPISPENLANSSRLFTESMMQGGYLCNLFADRKNNYVFITALYPKTKENIQKKTYQGVAFIILDGNLKQMDEEHFFHPTTDAGFVIPVSNGILFSLDMPNNPNFSETKARFALYRYE